MARRTNRSNKPKTHSLKQADELSFVYKSSGENDIYGMAETLEASQTDKICGYLDRYLNDFHSIYAMEYVLSATVTFDRKKEQNALIKMEQLNKDLIHNILSVENGYKVMELAERKYGAKVNWQDVPVSVITSEECMDFLASKKYDFNAKQTHNGKKTDFTTYHTTALAQTETESIEKFDKLRASIRQRDKLIQDFQKMRAEYSKPETTSERKKELFKQMKQMDEEFKPIIKEIPQKCDEVTNTMLQYFVHASMLKHAADKEYLSDENLKKIQMDKLRESVLDMVERLEKMEKINEFFNPQSNQANATKSSEQTLAEAKVYGAGGISGMLANAENNKAVYASSQANQATPSDLMQKLAQTTNAEKEPEIDSSILTQNLGARSNG